MFLLILFNCRRRELKERPHEAAFLGSGGLERSGAYPMCQRQGYTLDKLPVCPRVMKTHTHPLSHLLILPGFHLTCMSSDCGRKLKLKTTYHASGKRCKLSTKILKPRIRSTTFSKTELKSNQTGFCYLEYVSPSHQNSLQKPFR